MKTIIHIGYAYIMVPKTAKLGDLIALLSQAVEVRPKYHKLGGHERWKVGEPVTVEVRHVQDSQLDTTREADDLDDGGECGADGDRVVARLNGSAVRQLTQGGER